MPRAVYRPGASVKISGCLMDYEANVPVAGATIQLQQRDVRTGRYNTIAEARTGATGDYSLTLTLPMEEGSISLRLYFPGTNEYAADASPPVSITVKKPKAAKSTLSVTIE